MRMHARNSKSWWLLARTRDTAAATPSSIHASVNQIFKPPTPPPLEPRQGRGTPTWPPRTMNPSTLSGLSVIHGTSPACRLPPRTLRPRTPRARVGARAHLAASRTLATTKVMGMGMGRVIKPEVFSRFRSTHLAWAPRGSARTADLARGGGMDPRRTVVGSGPGPDVRRDGCGGCVSECVTYVRPRLARCPPPTPGLWTHMLQLEPTSRLREMRTRDSGSPDAAAAAATREPGRPANSYIKSSLQSLARVVKPRHGPELVCLLLAPSLC